MTIINMDFGQLRKSFLVSIQRVMDSQISLFSIFVRYLRLAVKELYYNLPLTFPFYIMSLLFLIDSASYMKLPFSVHISIGVAMFVLSEGQTPRWA